MDVDEGNLTSRKGHQANIESVDDDQFFEFNEVESIMNPDDQSYAETPSENEVPTCRICWRS